MSRPEPATFNCPICGWALKTPFGKEDLDASVACHNQKHPNKSLRMTKAELIDKVAAPPSIAKK